jgi:hypothetical protein
MTTLTKPQSPTGLSPATLAGMYAAEHGEPIPFGADADRIGKVHDALEREWYCTVSVRTVPAGPMHTGKGGTPEAAAESALAAWRLAKRQDAFAAQLDAACETDA